MTINTLNSESLYIKIDGSAAIKNSIIHCPDYDTSRYEGPLAAPCVIDLGTGGYFQDEKKKEDTSIIAPNGFPKGVVFPSGIPTGADQATITCTRIDGDTLTTSSILTDLSSSADCYWTSDPTKAPSHSPSPDPTADPSTSPTKKPTDNPTPEPTENPTKEPTAGPTAKPTGNPTDEPSGSPTTAAPTTNSPTNAPISGTESPSMSTTETPTISPSDNPSKSPTSEPSLSPSTRAPTSPTAPSLNPSISPTMNPTIETSNPSTSPTIEPTSGEGNSNGIVSGSTASPPQDVRASDSLKSEPPLSMTYIILISICICFAICCIPFMIHLKKRENSKEPVRRNTKRESSKNTGEKRSTMEIQSQQHVQRNSLEPQNIRAISNNTIPDEKMVGLIDLRRDQTEQEMDNSAIQVITTPIGHEGSFAHHHKEQNQVFVKPKVMKASMSLLKDGRKDTGNDRDLDQYLEATSPKPKAMNFRNQESILAEELYADATNKAIAFSAVSRGDMISVKSMSDNESMEESSDSSDSDIFGNNGDNDNPLTPIGPEPVSPMANHNVINKNNLNVDDDERDLEKRASAEHYVDTRGNHLAGIVMNVEDNDYAFEKNVIGSILNDENEDNMGMDEDDENEESVMDDMVMSVESSATTGGIQLPEIRTKGGWM